jgi:ElaB/YqjD/DUF883 family membrane-anchored ribosome-binding protein
MPKGNQERHNGGADRGGREQAQAVGQRIQEGAAQVGQRVSEGYDSVREEAARRYRRAEGMMARNPTPSVLIALGVGFGLGLVLTTLLARPEETWAERNLPDRLRRAPDALSNLAESLRNLPEAIARNLPSQFRQG